MGQARTEGEAQRTSRLFKETRKGSRSAKHKASWQWPKTVGYKHTGVPPISVKQYFEVPSGRTRDNKARRCAPTTCTML